MRKHGILKWLQILSSALALASVGASPRPVDDSATSRAFQEAYRNLLNKKDRSKRVTAELDKLSAPGQATAEKALKRKPAPSRSPRAAPEPPAPLTPQASPAPEESGAAVPIDPQSVPREITFEKGKTLENETPPAGTDPAVTELNFPGPSPRPSLKVKRSSRADRGKRPESRESD